MAFIAEVIVGNIGTVYRGNNDLEAWKAYVHYVKLSQDDVGKAAGESVVIMNNGEIVREYCPP